MRWDVRWTIASGLVALAVGVGALSATAQELPRPVEVWGFEPGADYKLADYTQVQAYLHKLDAASDRVQVQEIGRSVQGRPLLLVLISSEANLANLERYRSISERLALAQDLTDDQARALAREGKAVVFIDGGLHSTEVAHGQHTSLLAWRVASEESEEMRRIRDNVILLIMPVVNPDGMDMTVNWYRQYLGTPFENAPLPALYHFYAGHDNNRDWALMLQPETRAVSRVLYHEWYPQITYNHHQSGPFPARIEMPPFGDPVNPNIHPLVVRGTNLVGEHMGLRFERERKPGVIQYAGYDMWRADGVRFVGYVHNVVGVHSETAAAGWAAPRYYSPDSLPATFRFDATLSASQPSIFYPNPWRGGWWRLRDAVDYMITADLGTLDIAARDKEQWLFDRYSTGRDAIVAGKAGGPFAYVFPAGQRDPGEAVELLRVLRQGNAEIQRAGAAFQAGGKTYPAGSYVALSEQAFGRYLDLMLDKQVYPDDRLYPGGPPIPPYDIAGWTFPISMGVTVDRIERPFRADLAAVDSIPQDPGQVSGSGRFGYLLPNRANAVALAVNRLLAARDRLSWTTEAFTVAGQRYAPGTVVIENRGGTGGRVEALARELGLDFVRLPQRPGVAASTLRPPRVGLYKSWVSNIDEGWARWLLQKEYEFAVDTLHDVDLRGGNLSAFDAIVIPSQDTRAILEGHRPGSMPPEYVGGVGKEGAAALSRYVENGGTLVALDEATDFVIKQFGLPLQNAVQGLAETQYYIPGSLIRIAVDTTHPMGFGLPKETAAFVEGGTAFDIPPVGAQDDDGAPVMEVVVRYGDRDLLLSGWEIGAQAYLANRAAVVRVSVGRGSVVLLGFRPQFRGYPRATYKLLFNALYSAAAGDRSGRRSNGTGARGIGAEVADGGGR